MRSKNDKKINLLPIILIALAAITRVIPHPPNFTAVGSSALYSGRYLNGWWRFLVPLTAMFITDIILGFHITMPFVYVSFLISVGLGVWISKKPSVMRVGSAAITGSIIFYIITNFGVWLTGSLYSKDFIGLINCYTMAIPFFKWTILGDIAYTTIMFGATEIIIKKFSAVALKSKEALWGVRS